jgi:Domain of unknown function (DUF4331)
MPPTRKLLGALAPLAAVGVIAALGAGPLFVSGADHLDSPLVKLDPRVDITDIYAWRTGVSNTTLALNVNPLTSVPDSKAARFSQAAMYEFKIDTNGDARADVAYRVRFSDLRHFSNGTNDQIYTVRRATGAAAQRTEWSGATVAIGRTTRYGLAARVAAMAGGGTAFAGPRDDPFFFDLVGFRHLKSRILAGSTDLGSPGDAGNCALADDDPAAELLSCFTGTDTFAGTNVSSIVLRLPNSKLGGTGKTAGVWATTAIRTNGGWQRIDRMGRPAINTVFNITDAEKDLQNLLDPKDDRGSMNDTTVAVLNAFGNVLSANSLTPYSAAEVNAIANVLLPDTLTLTLGSKAHFASGTSLGTLKLNGRKPADDVINAEFALVTNFNITSDGVDANDSSFSSSFPYFAAPH